MSILFQAADQYEGRSFDFKISIKTNFYEIESMLKDFGMELSANSFLLYTI